MAIMASFPGRNLFSSVPTTAPNTHNHRTPPSPPISVPKYPPKSRPPKPSLKPPFTRIPHNRSKYYKPVSPAGEEIIASEDDNRAVIIGESGVSYRLPGAPFEFQFSYSETPKAKPLAMREPAFLPFAPPSMPRPWTGKAPLKSKKEKEKKKIPLFESLNPPPLPGMKRLEMPGPYKLGEFGTEGRKMSREEVLGEPLSRAEVKALFQPLASDNRQVNLGRDGLTHNMLELVHSHWKRQSVCKVKCKGVPTVDMDNVCRCLEERTGGKIIHRAGGVVYLFRGRNYNYNTRPKYPVMLWKPAAPVYPKLIQDAPRGLTERQANELKNKGKRLLPICKLSKNGVYVDLVNDVRHAFEGSTLVKIDCQGLEPSDYKKIGAKLMELVPCVLLSFDNEQILMWRGLDWKSMYPDLPIALLALDDSEKSEDICGEGRSTQQSHRVVSSPRMMSLWKRALESSKAVLLDEIEIGPDALLQKVEAFHGMTQAVEYSYPARIVSGDDEHFDDRSNDDDDEDNYDDDDDDDDDDDEEEFDDYDSGSFEEADPAGPLGSLPIDLIAKRLHPRLDT